MQPDSNQSSPGSRGAWLRRALIAELVFALSLAGCFSHDFVSSARVRIGNLRVVSEKRVGRTLFEYQLAADCRNDAPPVHGVTALAISDSPEIAIVQGMLHCGPLAVDGGNGASEVCAAGGSGGGIQLATGTLAGTGLIRAQGGASAHSGYSGGGGGGRIAILYTDATGFGLGQVTAAGGVGFRNGSAGSVHLVLYSAP